MLVTSLGIITSDQVLCAALITSVANLWLLRHGHASINSILDLSAFQRAKAVHNKDLLYDQIPHTFLDSGLRIIMASTFISCVDNIVHKPGNIQFYNKIKFCSTKILIYPDSFSAEIFNCLKNRLVFLRIFTFQLYGLC